MLKVTFNLKAEPTWQLLFYMHAGAACPGAHTQGFRRPWQRDGREKIHFLFL
jgi:hypothetical protein